jgi:hypothetical protein
VELITRFSLVTHEGPYDQWPRATSLLIDGAPSGMSIPGYVIDAQYQCDDGYLLVTSYDCPFEESYTCLLLAEDLSVRARADLGVPYGTFLLHAHWPTGDRTLRLHFQTRLFYSLTIQPPAGFFRPSYALRLRRERPPADDASARDSVQELEAHLAAIRDHLDQRAPGESD